MEPNATVTLLQAIIGSVGGLTISLTLIRLMIWKGNQGTKDEVKLLKTSTSENFKIVFKRLDEHGAVYDRYLTNEAFFKAIEAVTRDGVDLVNDPDEEFEFGEDVGCYIELVAEQLKNFAKDILIIGANEVADEVVLSKISSLSSKLKIKTEEAFGKQNAVLFKRKYTPTLRKYAKDVQEISSEIGNDKNGKFRDMTIMFLRKSISVIARFGISCKTKK